MDIYTRNLTALLALCAALFFASRRQQDKSSSFSSSSSPSSSSPSSSSPSSPQNKTPETKTKTEQKRKGHAAFLTVYALVMASDWLQGPYLYPLYRDFHSLPSSTISALFTTGFVSGAISGGVVGSWADRYGRKKACTENYGETSTTPNTESTTKKQPISSILLSKPVLTLGLASTIFEGSMYLFVFFWTPALRSVSSSESDLPYGVIFACFMAATLASSLAFGMLTSSRRSGTTISQTTLLVTILAGSATCFVASARPTSEQTAFWVFCLFEAAVGMYFPCMGSLKGKLVDDGVRAQVYGMLRVPLNVFVVVSLLVTGGGGDFASVFMVCSGLLATAAGAVRVLL
ncbi:hypothetical protein QBC47DRAFT_398440 [Echria macrotheca]|uniref:Molybdate-anion transporter n=1 Tax=Echria macrotheca TaxID=438768 RepID=A0AAJ0BK13_9PEZI|nr:hypothetical protein QBC47DRAFT_398440 [Echria macrotheca]